MVFSSTPYFLKVISSLSFQIRHLRSSFPWLYAILCFLQSEFFENSDWQAGYGKAGLLLIGADGQAKDLPVTLNADGTLTAELSELGLCVVYQKGAAGMDPSQPTDAEEPEAGFPIWIAVAIGGAVVAGGALVLVLVLKKKKAQ